MGFYTESARRLINPMDVPAFFEECAKTERKLFEGLIELDFAEVYCESGLAVFTEEEKAAANDAATTGFKATIEKLYKDFVEALTKAYNNIKDKLSEFFNKTASLVNSKVLQDPKAKFCPTKDIWFAEYASKMDELVNIKELNNILTDLTNREITDENYTASTADFRRRLNDSIDKVPTSVIEYEEGRKAIKPVILGKQTIGELQTALSAGGIGKDIASVFNTLKTDDSMKFKIKDTDSDGVKKGKEALASNVFQAKIAFFMVKCKTVSNTLKIARRNYASIASYVRGGAEAKNESAFLYETLSDMFCESVFGI